MEKKPLAVLTEWMVALVVTVWVTLGLMALKADSTSAGMAFLVLVVLASTEAGMGLALAVAGFCAMLFDYYFLEPRHSLALNNSRDWLALFCFVLSSLIVGRVAKMARKQAGRAERRQAEVERLYALSQELMRLEDSGELARELPEILKKLFGLEAVVLFVCDKDLCYASSEEAAGLPVELDLRQLVEGKIAGRAELAKGFVGMALMQGQCAVGALGWRPGSISVEMATAVSAQVAMVLTRAMALEASAHSEAMRESERLRTALVDSLTHELRTPLTSIRAAATTLLEGQGLDEELRHEMALVVDEESRRLDALIGEAVEMAEMEANSVEMRLEPNQERPLMEQAVEQLRRVLAGRRVAIACEGLETEGMGERRVPVWLDGHMLSRVMKHLLENAARFTEEGGEIRIGSQRGGKRLNFFVEDDGPGFAAEDLALVFEKFYRGRQMPGRLKGTGMGLAIVRAILKVHGGGVVAENRVEGGARVRFWVPLVEREPAKTPRTTGASGESALERFLR